MSEQRSQQPTGQHEQMARQHIFVVNGSPPVLDLLRDIFQSERYNVTTTNFVPNTFDQITAADPDLLMVDVVAGDHAGWELLDRLPSEAETRGLPVIIFSTSPALLDHARQLAASSDQRRFLDKPFDIDALLALVGELIGPA